MAGMALKIWVLLVPAWALQPKELEDWFASPSGLAMTTSDAAAAANQHWNALAQCGVEIRNLQALKDTLSDRNSIDLPLPDIRSQIIQLAEQHIASEKLQQLYRVLSSGYTLSGGLALPKDEAQTMMHLLALKKAEPEQLKALYQVMYGYSGLGFAKSVAQTTSIQLAQAGADASQFKATYLATVQKGQAAAITEASKAAVAHDLAGLVRRYALDAKPYTASEFLQHYGEGGWLDQWLDSPLEKRVSNDRQAYTANQFSRHFPGSWEAMYKQSPEATQLRLAQDGKTYSMLEYQQYYGDQWHDQWSVSPELSCKECAPYVGVFAVLV
ncbi:rps1 [Symbiodinium natans]|uniref:Rps1 protein n=1 Tax=Symbiodinium natans TaxID=878477 RepID=A0A812TE84_9DINO|nr:rps1 [Symbiodinium natans]